jgi:hypothetical protein
VLPAILAGYDLGDKIGKNATSNETNTKKHFISLIHFNPFLVETPD